MEVCHKVKTVKERCRNVVLKRPMASCA